MTPRTISLLSLGALLAGSSLLAQPAPPSVPPVPPVPPVPAVPETNDVYVLDPEFPADIAFELRSRMLSTLKSSLSESFQDHLRVHADHYSGVLLLQGPPVVRERAVLLHNTLRERLLKNLPELQKQSKKEPALELEGSPLGLDVEIVLATRSPNSERPLPEALAKSLSEKLGFQGFHSLGKASLEATVGSESEVKTLVPDGPDRSLEVRLTLVPEAKPELQVKAQFEVVQFGTKKGEVPIRTSLQTSYRPRLGKPTVIGASPISGESSLVFLVNHRGEGLEKAAQK